MAATTTPPPTPEPPRPRLSWFGTVIAIVLPALGLIAFLATTAWWLASTPSGLRAVAALSSAFVPGLSVRGVAGTIADGAQIEDFELVRDAWSLKGTKMSIRLREVSLQPRRLDVERFDARRLQIEWRPSSGAAAPPASLGLPFELFVRQAQVGELALGARGSAPAVFRQIDLSGRMDPEGLEVERVSGEFDRTRIAASGRIGAAAPFTIAAQARLGTTLRERAVEADIAARGSLTRMQLELVARDAASHASASATLRSFDAVLVERLSVDADDFDPSLWFAEVPAMRLAVRGELLPRTAADGTWTVSGPFYVENRTPGPLDRNQVPARTVRGTLAWAADALRLDIERAEGVRGSAAGTLTWSRADGVLAQARFTGIDAATLHSRAVTTSADGQMDYGYKDGEQRFRGSLRNTRGLPLVADIDASLRAQVLDVAQARLQLGQGRADVRGRFEMTGRHSVHLNGSFRELDLAQLVRGLDTRLNGTLSADGRLQTPIAGHASIELADSRIAGRPVTGRGTVEVEDRRFEADVELRSGASRLTASGGLGAGRELRVTFASPDIGTLLPDYGGWIEASATVTGEMEAARIDGTVALKNLLVPGGHRIVAALAAFRGGLGPNEPLALTAEVTRYTGPAGPDASIASARLVGRGTTADATLELIGMTASQQPLRVIVSGGLQRGAWRGSIVGAEWGSPLDLEVRKPVPLTIGQDVVELGPAEFQLRGARFSEFQMRRGDAHWRWSGRFEGLQPQTLDAAARAPRRVVRTGAGDRVPLTLAGRWDIDYTDAGVSGIAVVERTGGDIYSGIDALNPIGVSDVGAALNILDNRVTGNVYIRGRALGRIDALVDAYLDPKFEGGRVLSQARPFRVVIDAELPDLSWVGPLIGDNVQFAGRAGVKATIAGTPGDPTSTGTVTGDGLRLAWVDQAVRLENGRLDGVLEDGVLVINELSFAGTPRVSPRDLRALEGLVSEKPFEVRAVGRIALASLTGSIGLHATQLPVLQRADRWMVVSGDGGITLSPQRAELYAKLGVDGAYFNFSGRRGARTLPNDVVVSKAGAQRKSAAAPVDVTVDMQADLGQRFYIEGDGLEARLAGSISVSGRPSQLRGEGSVRTVDGIYAGYGQRLQIARGIVTFQGPIDNPSLNVLAVRAGLPVEVGVAISGTAQKPFVRLHSDPSMSDTEKLNWLVLGRPPGANDGNDRAMLSAAASALFAGQADSASASLMRTLGIDQITLQPGQSSASLLPRETVAGRLRSGGTSTSSPTTGDFLTVGKRINDDLFLSFEQALTGAEYFVALNYRLTRQLSLIARAGSTNALDLVYSLAFD
ncbi:MAG TPA: translocation/assembly module TamB domain-containing protein [Burkholderiaceae bacterium]|nr:translocation/assembly module TamB domain-containing protein [Burkholderiaceae bacterium]